MLITIVIPCHNAAAFVERAIISCLRQEGVEIEIIAVENNSTDNTYAVLQTLAEKHPSKLKVVKEKKSGASAARNCGWRMGEGKYIQFLDADDELLPGKLLRQLKLISDLNGGIVTGTPVYENLLGDQEECELWENTWKGLAHGMHAGQTSANLYHRQRLERIHGWDENLPDTQDADLLARLMMDRIILVQDRTSSCVCYDRESGKISKKDPEGILVRHVELRNRINSFLLRNENDLWEKDSVFFCLATYRLIRMLACYDPVKAQLLFDQYLPIKFRIEANKSLNIPYWDALFVNMLGLKRFATLKNNLKRFVPDSLWRAMKFYLNKIGFRFLQNPE